MEFKARETIFFYKVDGELRQAVEVETDIAILPGQLEIEIITGHRGCCTTRIDGLPEGGKKFICFAPVVYPNMVDGVHQPVIAGIAVRSAERDVFKGVVEIGKHRPWTIFICQDICTDYTWGMPFDQTKKVSAEFILEHLNFMRKTDELPDNMKHRWNMNQTAEIEWFQESQEDEAVEEFFKREKEGRVEISATYNANLSSMLSTEQAIRSLYHARELWEKQKISLDTLEHMEMPTITWGMISIYAKAGLKFFTKAWYDFINLHLRKMDNIPLFYWEGPDKSRLLAFMPPAANSKAHYMHARFFINNPYQAVADELHNWWIPQFEGNDKYPFDSFMLLGAYGDLHVSSKYCIDSLIGNMTRYNNEPWEYPKLVNATWRQFFEHVAEHAGEHNIPVPVISGDMGTSWETWPAHYAHVAAKARRGAEDFIAAEKLAAVRSLFDGKISEDSAESLKTSMKLMNLLAEHPWNGTNDDEKYRSYEMRRDWADRLYDNNKSIIQSFAGSYGCGDGDKTGKASVLNLMSWDRTDEVSIDVSELDSLNMKGFTDVCTKSRYMQKGNFADEWQEICPNTDMDDCGCNWQKIKEFGEEKIVFVAESVPAMGYVNQAGNGMRNHTGISTDGNIIENQFYKITLSRFNGSIVGLWDKKNNCELVNEKERMGINQFIYDSNGSRRILGDVKITPVNCGPVRASLMAEGEAQGCKVVSIITLYSCLDKISITNKILKEPGTEPSNLYFAFPFNISQREYHYDCAGSIMKPGLQQYGGDQVKGAGQEAYSARNFIDISNSGMGVTLSPYDSYLFQFGDMNVFGTMSDSPSPANATVYSLVMTNHHSELLGNQGHNEEFCFRYAVKTHTGGYNAVNAMRFGLGENNPMLVFPAFDKGNMLLEGESLTTCKNDNVVITAFKNSESNDGSYILRLWEIKGEDCMAEIDVSKAGFSSACMCDIIERETGARLKLDNGKLNVQISAMAIETVKLFMHC